MSIAASNGAAPTHGRAFLICARSFMIAVWFSSNWLSALATSAEVGFGLGNTGRRGSCRTNEAKRMIPPYPPLHARMSIHVSRTPTISWKLRDGTREFRRSCEARSLADQTTPIELHQRFQRVRRIREARNALSFSHCRSVDERTSNPILGKGHAAFPGAQPMLSAPRYARFHRPAMLTPVAYQ